MKIAQQSIIHCECVRRPGKAPGVLWIGQHTLTLLPVARAICPTPMVKQADILTVEIRADGTDGFL